MKKIMMFLIVSLMTMTSFGQDNWSTIMTQNFEQGITGNWDAFLKPIPGLPSGWQQETYWGSNSYANHTSGGSKAAWCAGDGPNPINPDPNSGQGYVNGINSWMTYGPFDLTDAGTASAELSFWYSYNCYPSSINGYFVVRISNDTSNWYQNPIYPTDTINLSFTNTSGVASDPLNWTLKTINLSNYIGEINIFIGFQYYEVGQYSADAGGWIDDVTLRKDVNVGMNEYNQTNNVNVYPNPSNGNFTIDNLKTNTPLFIYDMSGRTVYESITTDKQIKVNLTTPGIYMMKSGTTTKKIIVK